MAVIECYQTVRTRTIQMVISNCVIRREGLVRVAAQVIVVQARAGNGRQI